ncbi:hypothetical protein SAMD00019534_029860, partial [Acytostelium subglobosum LB1]|uniref:hypothetical protein n=1 Tax=Acytostelium subglobosum LB1 TaxID=1410327 RepID=UPI00064487E3
SPPFTTSTSPYVFNLPSYNDWNYNTWYGGLLGYTQLPTGALYSGIDIGGSLNVTHSKWNGQNFVMASLARDFYLRKDHTYTMSLDLLTGTANLAVNLSLCAYPSYNVTRGKFRFESGVLETSTCFPFTQTGVNLAKNTAWTSVSLTFTPLADIPITPLGLSMFTKPNANPSTVFLRGMKFTVLAAPHTPPTLLTKDSEIVNLRKPTTGLIAQNRSTCPHLQSGLLHWHDPATWGGAIPSPSSVITLPENSKVLISSCSIIPGAVFLKIVVPATSQLIFSDASYSMTIQDMDVRGQLLMGTSTCRMNGNIEIVFTGQYTTADTIAPRMGSKGIAVAKGGYISVQGKQYYKTWSRLASHAYAYESIIYLQDTVNWEPGQKVFITTSKYKDELYPQNEVRVIRAISGNKIEFTEPLQFFHYAGQEYQAEVGLLSRRIVFRGANDSDANQFGGHVLTMSNGQFAGIELIKMGQTNIKGRYPLHFHLAGVVNNSYISDCSTHDTFYRCYTIHGTNNLLLTQNVAFNAIGHCYYIEDGVEENNTISFNLAASVHTIGRPADGSAQNAQFGETFQQSPTLTQPADSAAGCFYITNAYNRIVGNAASGGWASYAFPNLVAPVGFYRNQTNIQPESRPTLEFDGNTAHSSGYYFNNFGACIYCGGRLYYANSTTDQLTYISGRQARETKDAVGKTAWMRWTNTKTWQCPNGVGHWGNQVEVEVYESHDNEKSGTVFGAAWMNNAIINGFSNNPVDLRFEEYYESIKRQGFQFYDTVTQTIITNINFRNFQHDPTAPHPEADNSVIVSMTHSDLNKPQQISATRNITFTNVQHSQIIGHYIRETGASRYFNYIDWDGSSVGETTPQIIGSSLNWWYFSNSCVFKPEWRVHVCPKGSAQIGTILFESPGLTARLEEHTILGNTSLFAPNLPAGPHTAYFTSNPVITGMLNMGWHLNFANLVSPPTFTLQIRQIPFGNYLLLAVPYPAGTTFTGVAEHTSGNPRTTLTKATSQTAVLSGNGSLYHFDGSNLFIKLVNPKLTGSSSEAYTRGGASV